MQATRDKQLLAALKRNKPSKVVAFTSDAAEDARPIAVPNHRKAWDRVMKALSRIPWVRVEMMNKAGELLDTYEDESPAGELAELPAGKGMQEHALALAIVRTVTEHSNQAVERVLANRAEEMKTILTANKDVLSEMTRGMHALVGMYKEHVAVVRESESERTEAALAQAQAQQAAESAGLDWKQIMELLPALPNIVKAMQSMLGSGAPDVPSVSNGHNRKATT